MHFNKIFLLVITFVLTTLSFAAPIEPKTHDIYIRLNNGCLNGASKRDLESRTDTIAWNPFPMGQFREIGRVPIGLSTDGLVTCIGVAVTFTDNQGNLWRFLAHLSAASYSTRVEFGDMAAAISKVVTDNGPISNMQCVVSPPDLNGDKPTTFPWKDTDATTCQNTLNVLTPLVAALCTGDGTTITTKVHPMRPAATMKVDANNIVYVNGVAVT